MKKLLAAVFVLLGFLEANAQVERSADFHEKYSLKQVVVLSRHNIRSPLSGPESALGRITPHEWFRWTSAPSELPTSWRQMPLLSLQNPPIVYGMKLNGLQANDDGLYRLADFEQRLEERIEANGATPAGIQSMQRRDSHAQAKVYDLQGRQTVKSLPDRGIYIKNARKVIATQ